MSEIVKQGDTATVKPGCNIVASMVDDFKNELKGLAEGEYSRLIVDLTGTKMIDSMGIGVLIAAYNSLKKRGAQLELVNVSDEISGLLKSMRLNQYFIIP